MAYTSCTISTPVSDVEQVVDSKAYMSTTSNGNINWLQAVSIDFKSTNSTTWTVCALENYYLRGLTIQYTKTTDPIPNQNNNE